MARIRTIKPEFPQSESMGRVSREARLLFLQLFTIVDDDGRVRGAPRMLASLLYPYDDDAKDLIASWLDELEAEACVQTYGVDGQHYLSVVNWRDHQKIDKPTRSKLPSPPTVGKKEPSSDHICGGDNTREPSRALATTDTRSSAYDNLTNTQIPAQAVIENSHSRQFASPREGSAADEVQSRGFVGGLEGILREDLKQVPGNGAGSAGDRSANLWQVPDCKPDNANGAAPRKPEAISQDDIHHSLPCQEWDEWMDHRRRKRWPMDGMTLRKQLKILARHDTETQREMLNTSIQAGWQGLFDPKTKKPQKPERGFVC